MSPDELNAFMKEQRNRARIAREDPPASEESPDDDEEPELPPHKEKPAEMGWKERNDFMREQRHARRANKAKFEAELAGVNMDDLVAQAEKEQRENPVVEEPKPAKPLKPPEEQPPQKGKPPQMSLQEINDFMREQRHARRANKARAEAGSAGVNMDDLVAEAEREQRQNPPPSTNPASQPSQIASPPSQASKIGNPPSQASKVGNPAPQSSKAGNFAPPPVKIADPVPKGTPPKMSVAEARRQKGTGASGDEAAMKNLFQQQRDEMRLNRERIKQVRDGTRDPGASPPVRTSNRRLLQNIPKAPASFADPDSDPEGSDTPRSSGPTLEEILDAATDSDSGGPLGGDEVARLDGLMAKASMINSVLDTLEDDSPVDAPESDRPVPFFLTNKVLNFPVVKDQDSMAYRAEAIRAFLEREIGLDRLLALKQAVLADEPGGVEDVLKDCEPGIVVLAQQLLVLDE
jgi:hypothetical protein